MIALYLLACHLVGDFVLQSRWQAAAKLRSRRVRLQHCVWYTMPFVVLALAVGGGPLAWYAFPVCVFALHYLTDSRRYASTLGDVIQWRLDVRADPVACKREWLEYVTERAESSTLRSVDVSDAAIRWPTPNPWPSTSFAVDQSLHVVQIAALAGLLLS